MLTSSRGGKGVRDISIITPGLQKVSKLSRLAFSSGRKTTQNSAINKVATNHKISQNANKVETAKKSNTAKAKGHKINDGVVQIGPKS